MPELDLDMRAACHSAGLAEKWSAPGADELLDGNRVSNGRKKKI